MRREAPLALKRRNDRTGAVNEMIQVVRPVCGLVPRREGLQLMGVAPAWAFASSSISSPVLMAEPSAQR